jgi:hypothetical protein
LMRQTAWRVIVPLALASLLTGLVQSLGTTWGLFRYYWIGAKLVLTVLSTAILLAKMRLVDQLASATDPGLDLRRARLQLALHAFGAVIILLGATALSVLKPWGKTSYGQRIFQGEADDLQRRVRISSPSAAPVGRDRELSHGGPTVGKMVLAGIGATIAVFVILHLLAGASWHR